MQTRLPPNEGLVDWPVLHVHADLPSLPRVDSSSHNSHFLTGLGSEQYGLAKPHTTDNFQHYGHTGQIPGWVELYGLDSFYDIIANLRTHLANSPLPMRGL